jgi:carbon storage regulator
LSERIMIGEDIEIVVVALTGSRVQLGIAAPRETKVLRGELEETGVDSKSE